MKLRRTSMGLTQQELAEALGVTFQQVQKYERGANRIGASRLYDISQILDAPYAFFFDGMSGETAEQSPMRRIGASEPPTPPLQPDAPMDRATMDLLVAFREISDPALKRRVIDLCRALSSADA
ncbi:MAG: helix-turn-helix domain-containing protein [Alphaproteobacteria bacterium]|nr:helix-turn-helix domain-containing protein [Alphaproteobacteria bacterium]